MFHLEKQNAGWNVLYTNLLVREMEYDLVLGRPSGMIIYLQTWLLVGQWSFVPRSDRQRQRTYASSSRYSAIRYHQGVDQLVYAFLFLPGSKIIPLLFSPISLRWQTFDFLSLSSTGLLNPGAAPIINWNSVHVVDVKWWVCWSRVPDIQAKVLCSKSRNRNSDRQNRGRRYSVASILMVFAHGGNTSIDGEMVHDETEFRAHTNGSQR